MRASLRVCAFAVVCLVFLALAGTAHRIGLPLDAALVLLRWAGYAGLVALVLSVVTAAYTWRKGAKGAAVVAGVGVVLALVTVAVPVRLQQRARRVPAIHDISTDLENPPTFAAVLPLRAGAPNGLDRSPAVTEQQRTGYPDLAPVTLPLPIGAAFGRAVTLAQQAGWEIVSADAETGRLEAVDTTWWFGFKDDVVVRLVPWGSGTRVDVRSVSRVQESDAGANAARVRAFLAAMQQP